MNEDIYAKNLIDKIKEIEIGLKYYIDRTHELELENENLSKMYENRINEFIKAPNRAGGKR